GLALDREAATFIFTALSGDTGSFRYSNTTAEALEAARQAVLAGARPQEVAHNLYERRTLEELQLLGRALSLLSRTQDGAIAWIALPHSLVEGQPAEAFDGLVNYPRMVEGVEVALLFREEIGRASCRERVKGAAVPDSHTGQTDSYQLCHT